MTMREATIATIRSLPTSEGRRAIEAVRAIQSERSSTYDGGILVANYSRTELEEFSHGYASDLWVAAEGSLVVAYCIVTDLRHLVDFAPAVASRVAPGHLYIAQLATAKPHGRRGLASRLIDSVRSTVGVALVTDVLIEPITNHASLSFFAKVGFRDVMDVESSFREFGRTVSRVLRCP